MITRKALLGSILIGTLACSGVAVAQTQEAERVAAENRADTTQVQEYDRDDDGFDWGLLGLLGLLGLIPRKRPAVVVHEANRNSNNPNSPNR